MTVPHLDTGCECPPLIAVHGEHIRIYLIFKYNLIIYHECEGEMEKKNLPMITDWHPEACRVMTNGDPEGRILLSNHFTKRCAKLANSL